MNDIERLLAIEEIKQVKAKYFWGLDHKDWELWRREVWAEDGELHVPEFQAEPFKGFDTVLAYVSDLRRRPGFGPPRPHANHRVHFGH